MAICLCFAVSYRMVRKINSVYALLKVRNTYSKWNQNNVEDGGRRKFTQILKVELMKKFRSKERNEEIKGRKSERILRKDRGGISPPYQNRMTRRIQTKRELSTQKFK